MIINGDGGYGLLAAYIGMPVAQAGFLGPKVNSHLAPFCIHKILSCLLLYYKYLQAVVSCF